MIRRATPADTEVLRAMMATSNGYTEPAARAMIVRFAAGWSVPEADHEVWVEDVAGEARGFYALIPHAEGLELDIFFTADAAQGSGVGRRLFAHMSDRARVLGADWVVISSNPRSAGFYRRMGAVDIGLTPPSGEIAWARPLLALALG